MAQDHAMACLEALADFKLKAPWTETLSITNTLPEVQVNDDIKRESAFYQLALTNATKMRKMVLGASIKFTRPNDYFAEMLKTDAHMEKVREKLLAEAKGMKNSEDAKKQRHLKKFGKQVQQQKVIERQASKSSELDKIKIARKKQSNNQSQSDEFGIQVEHVESDKKRKRGDEDRSGKRVKREDNSKPNQQRQHKNEKYGFGGQKRHAKSNDKKSTDDLKKFSVKKMKSGAKNGKTGGKSKTSRPGKDKRISSRGKN